MDSSVVSPDGNTSVFCSPDSQNSSPVKFQTSVSVSSLAEKFERSGDFGSVTENTSKVFESSDAPSQCSVEPNDNKSSLQSEKNISLSSDSANKNCDTDQTTCIENGAQGQQQSPDAATDIPTAVQQLENASCVYCVGLHSTTDIPTAVQQLENASCVYCVGLHSTNFTTDIATAAQEVKNKNVSCISCVGLQSSNLTKDIATAVTAKPIQPMNPPVQPSNSAAGICVENKVPSSSQDGSESPTQAQITKAVEERVAYFVEKISQNTVAGAASSDVQSFVPGGEAAKHSSTEPDISGIVRNISLKDLERSFVTALNMANCYEKVADKTADTLPLPSIQITEASDREDSGSDDVETKTKCEVHGTAVKTPAVEEMEESDAGQDSNKPIPSTSTATLYENKDGSEISPEERRQTLLQDRNRLFYISSSDIPANEPLENSDEIRQQSESIERMEFLGTNPVLVVTGENESSSCLCSKYVHGITFLICFIIALAGFILYNLAHEGKVPDFCEYLGLVTAILAGIIGAFSCFCYSILEAFPGIPARYERMRESRNIQSTNVRRNVQDNLDEESWSAEQERAFRIQNGMSSTRTSAASIKNDQSEYLMIRQSDHKELVDKAEKFKKDVVGLLDSFSDVMAEIKLIDKVGKLEAGVENGF